MELERFCRFSHIGRSKAVTRYLFVLIPLATIGTLEQSFPFDEFRNESLKLITYSRRVNYEAVIIIWDFD